jgi:hypothetical protein
MTRDDQERGECDSHCGNPLLSAVTVAFKPNFAKAPWIIAAGYARYYKYKKTRSSGFDPRG